MEEIFKFIEAQAQAEADGKNEFTCPICGGVAWWYRAEYNNHIHSGCNNCGFKMME